MKLKEVNFQIPQSMEQEDYTDKYNTNFTNHYVLQKARNQWTTGYYPK